MAVFILFGHEMNGDVADPTTAIDIGKQVSYRASGLFTAGNEERSPCLNFFPILRTSDGATIAYHGEEPTQAEIDEALSAARSKYPWKFIRH